jgi:predicted metal-dependent phosphotriesterase family hydrolase
MASGDACKVMTVTGPLGVADAGIADAHNHVWIAPVPGVLPGAFVLDDREAIGAELADYRHSGGRTIIDCQPGGCGRDGGMLAALSRASGVHIVACTGHHLRKHYPDGYWLFEASVGEARAWFIRELRMGLEEARERRPLPRAGFIKMACEATIEQSSSVLMEAAALAALETGAAVAVHTEKGMDAERIVAHVTHLGLSADRLVLYHMDKRPDFELHRTLAQEGVMLEYDTFYRPAYQPEAHVWPLLERMVSAGLDGQIAIGTDMADAGMWMRLGGSPGLVGLITRIIPRLVALGFGPDTIRGLVGGNIARRLAQSLSEKRPL